MKAIWPVLLGALAACGPSYGGQDVKTPEERLADEERLAEEQERKSKEHGGYSGPVEETDLEKKEKWDKKQVELELKRAARSAETCPASVTEDAPAGTATVSLTFGNDGHVKDSKISSPYEETAVGKCVLRAMANVIVPAYEGGEETVEWEIPLEASNKKPTKETTKK
jgi:hypothetical protein